MSLDLSKLVNVKRGPENTITSGCPVCRSQGADKTGNHLKVWLNTGAFNCVVAGKDRIHNRAIRDFLRGASGELEDVLFVEPPERLRAEPVYPDEMLTKLLKDHSYWVNRGVKQEVIAMLEGGVAPAEEKSKLSGRYVIPIRGLSGQINGWSGRLLTDSNYSPKYKHLFSSSQACWPWHIAGPHIIKSRKVVLQEGWSEWLFLHGSRIFNSLSLFGLNLSDVMVGQLLASDVRKIIISTNDDADEGRKSNGRVVKKGKLKALEIKEQLHAFWDPENVIIRHPKSDWGEATEEERQEFRAEIEAL